ncbi:type II toxin-antitoxin system VapC family toxin [bacterium]|nr:type II toxin-antitoxin system VapC family toxin [bacterium]
MLVEERHSPGARGLARQDPAVVVWQFAETEAVSALTKRTRMQPPLSEVGLKAALERLDVLAGRWKVIQALDEEKLKIVRARARALMLRYQLRAGDALQLAAALIYFDPPHRHGFVVVDGDLAEAADAEGLTVFLPDAPKKGGRQRS